MDKDLIEFAQIVGNLKKLKRSGWVRIGINEPESVADHSFRLAVLAMVVGDFLKLDSAKMVKMSLLDDVAEAIVGDIVVERGNKTVFDKSKKRNLEHKAMIKILGKIQNGDKYLALWEEAQAEKTLEAKIVKQLDKLEMAIQALEYESEAESKDLDEFFITARKAVVDGELSRVLDEIENRRES